MQSKECSIDGLSEYALPRPGKLVQEGTLTNAADIVDMDAKVLERVYGQAHRTNLMLQFVQTEMNKIDDKLNTLHNEPEWDAGMNRKIQDLCSEKKTLEQFLSLAKSTVDPDPLAEEKIDKASQMRRHGRLLRNMAS